jgi:pSer/pThr/pTyr-binding forkhead associated (FHA) protein
LTKYGSGGNLNHISREHITVFKEGEKFFVQDGKTIVQEKPSRNKTWLISSGQQKKEEITEKGRRELKDGDQISLADVVTLSFTLK